MQISVTSNIKEQYDTQYNDASNEWRETGAKYKVQNILDVAYGFEFEKILEVGAGDGSILKLLSKDNFGKELHALDISESSINSIKKKNIPRLHSAQVFDGYKIPFENDYFDLVILSHVIEHVEFPRALLREIKRVSKYQVIEIPRDYKYNADKRVKHFLSYGHINIYTPSLFRFLLLTEGFEIVKDKMSFISKELLMLMLKSKKTNYKFGIIKLYLFLIIRYFAYAFLPGSRQETMINAYTVLTKKKPEGIKIF